MKRSTKINACLFAVIAASAVSALSVNPSLAQGKNLKLMPNDGETVFGDNKVLSTLELGNGSKLHFVQVGPAAIGIAEDMPKGAKSIVSIPGLKADGPAVDVFYALSKPGTKLPQGLLVGSQKLSRNQSQGWARKFVAKPQLSSQTLQTGFCKNSDFQAWFNLFPDYNDRNTPVFRLDKVPRTSGFFEADVERPSDGKVYNFYSYTVGGKDGSISIDADRYVTRVAVCNIDSFEASNPFQQAHPPISYLGYNNPHMGPVVSVMFRQPGQSAWQTAIAKDFAAGEVGGRVWWHFNSGLNWDWQTDVFWAGADDSFDIGHAVEDLPFE